MDKYTVKFTYCKKKLCFKIWYMKFRVILLGKDMSVYLTVSK